MKVVIPHYRLSFRDYSPWFFLNREMEKRGWPYRHVPILDFKSVKDFKPDVIVMGDLYQPLLNRVAKVYHAWKIPIFQIPAEGMWNKKEIPIAAWDVRSSADYLWEGVSHWGEAQKEGFIEAGKNPDLQHLTGNPKHDLWAYPNVLAKMRQGILMRLKIPAQYKFIVTFACGAILYRATYSDFLQKVGIPNPKEAILQQHQLAKAMLTTLIKNNPDVFFIIKMHPLEDDENEIEAPAPGSFPNTYYCHHQPLVEELITISDIWISVRSTTNVEAWFCNRPTINLKVGITEEFLPTDHEKGSLIVKNDAQLMGAFDDLKEGKPMPQEVLNYRRDFQAKRFYRLDGKSSVRVLDALEQYLQLIHSPGWNIFCNGSFQKWKGDLAAALDGLTGPFGFYWRDAFKRKLRLTQENAVTDQNRQDFYRYIQEAINEEISGKE